VCPAGEDIQNQGYAVDDLYLEGFFQVALLERREFIVKDGYGVIGAGFKRYQLFQLTLTQVMSFGRPGQALYELSRHPRSSRARQLSQLVDGILR
jgi:hypothetical protein